MIKHLEPIDIETLGFNLSSKFPASLSNIDLESLLKEVMDKVYNEHPKFWINGLSPEHFSGYNDYVYPLIYNNILIGFIGLQLRNYISEIDEDTPCTYISIAILPEFRGHGIAKKMIAYTLNKHMQEYGKLINPIWTVNQDNKSSLALFKSLSKDDNIKNFNIRLIIDK